MKDYLELLSSVGKLKKFQKIVFYFMKAKRLKFFILLKGKIRIYKSTASDKEITLHYFNPPNFIAEMPAFKKLNYPANAVFEEDGEILEIDFINFQNLCSENKDSIFYLSVHFLIKLKF